MKKSVYNLGITCSILMLAGCIFKIMHWPGAGPPLVLSVLTYCFVFLPFALMTSYNGQELKKHKTLHIVTFFAFAITMMGALFKVMHWPGAGMFLVIGIPLPFVLFLPFYLYQTRDEKKSGNLNFLGIMFGLTFLAIFSVLLSLNVSRQIIDAAATTISKKDKATAFLKSALSEKNVAPEIQKAADDLCNYIDVLKCELLTATRNYLCTNNKIKGDYDVSEMNFKDNKEIPMQVLFGGENKIYILKDKIEAFHKSLLDSGKMSADLAYLVNSLFNVKPEITTPDEQFHSVSWEERELINFQLVFLLNSLSQIQSNARLVENEL